MDNGAELPHVAELCADGRPGEAASKRRCASLPRGSVQPARFFESQAFAVRLFREAPQLKTVTTIARIRRMHARRTEQQTPGISAVANSRSCPENSSITGLIQCTRIMIAAARGGAARHSNRDVST